MVHQAKTKVNSSTELFENYKHRAEEQPFSVSKNSVEDAIEMIRTHGFVVLRDSVPKQPLALIRRRMDQDTVKLLEYCASIGGNPRERGHLQQGPPPLREFVFGDVVTNPFVVDVCTELLGPNPTLTFYNGNTNYPRSTTQHLHMDSAHRNAHPSPVEPTFSVVVNIPPGPMNSSNGAIELWPGTHLVRTVDGKRAVNSDQMAERREGHPPVQPTTKTGDVLIRDIRLWHRGVPNRSKRPRHMIALVFVDGSSEVRGRLRFEKGCEQELEGGEINPNADYTDDPIDYLIAPTRRLYDFQRQQRKLRAKIGN